MGVLVRPASKVIVKFLQVMQKHGYIGDFELVDDHRAGKIVVELTGRINKCGVISPRFDVTVPEIEKWISSLAPVRPHCAHHLGRHHGPRGGAPQAHRWQDPRLLLLSTQPLRLRCCCRGVPIPGIGWPRTGAQQNAVAVACSVPSESQGLPRSRDAASAAALLYALAGPGGTRVGALCDCGVCSSSVTPAIAGRCFSARSPSTKPQATS